MKYIYRKHLLIFAGLSLILLVFISCSSNDGDIKTDNTLPMTMEVGKYTVTILDNIYINHVYTTTYIVESENGDLDNFLLFPKNLNDLGSTGTYSLIKNLDSNKRYIVLSTILQNKNVPETLSLEFEARDNSGDKRLTVVSNKFTFKKNVINDFNYVQGREINKTIKTAHGEIDFFKALYTEDQLLLFVNYIGTNGRIYDGASENEIDNYIFKINDMNESYSLKIKSSQYKTNDSWATSPQIVGYDNNVSWVETCVVSIPIQNLLEDETFDLNIYDRYSNQLIDSINLENIKPQFYDSN